MEQQLKSMIKSKPKSKYEDLDSSDISSLDEEDIDMLTNQDIEKKSTNTFVQYELLDKITKYLKIDSKIKEKQKEVRECMKVMKDQKADMEKYIVKYLEDVKEQYIKIDGEGKLIKTESIRRGAINTENIKTSVITSFKKENIGLDDKTFMNLIQTILEQVETNRPKTKKTFIKHEEEKKDTKEKKYTKEKKDTNEKKDTIENKQSKTKETTTKVTKVNKVDMVDNINKKVDKTNKIDSDDDDIPKYT